MAAKKGFDDFDPIFGEVKVESSELGASISLRPLLFYAHALDSSRFQIVVSDFHSLSWDRVLTIPELEDLRDDIGIGGTWSDFVDYFKSSLSMGEVKLVLNGQPNSDTGVGYANLMVVKSKGLPRICVSLNRLINSSVDDSIAKFSLALYGALKNQHKNALKEQQHSARLMGILSSEREKNDILQKQLDSLSFLSKSKVPKSKLSDEAPSTSDTITNYDQAIISEVQKPLEVSPTKDSQSTRHVQRVAPVSRRARFRGVSIQDTEGDNEK
ncbi:uncharacterized protein [Typha angustifolia]|uniref:uncharacterized protein n=1 Tax=Typha angustifolia TaxID=59011 RepID=UPI003C2E8928